MLKSCSCVYSEPMGGGGERWDISSARTYSAVTEKGMLCGRRWQQWLEVVAYIGIHSKSPSTHFSGNNGLSLDSAPTRLGSTDRLCPIRKTRGPWNPQAWAAVRRRCPVKFHTVCSNCLETINLSTTLKVTNTIIG